MIEFAVKVKGIHDVEDEDKATWVLAVDPVGDRLLIVHDDQSLHWHPMDDCKFVKARTPDQPLVVLPVQPQRTQEPVLLTPSRAQRRRAERNGP
jgi:hypothetical protein